MSSPSYEGPDPGLLDVVWAIVLIQGAVMLLATVEGFLGGIFFGSLPAAVVIGGLSLTGAILALISAKGLRRGRRWARRLTLVAEWLVLAGGVISVIGTSLIAAEIAGLVSILTTIIAPLTVIILLHNLRILFPVHVVESMRPGTVELERHS